MSQRRTVGPSCGVIRINRMPTNQASRPGLDVVNPLHLEPGPFVGGAQGRHRVAAVVPHLPVEAAHGEVERGDEHDDSATTRAQQPVGRGQRVDVTLDVLEDVDGHQGAVVRVLRGQHVDVPHVHAGVVAEPPLEQAEAARVAVGHRDLGGTGVEPGLGIVAEAAADLKRVLAQVGPHEVSEPRVVVHRARQ